MIIEYKIDRDTFNKFKNIILIIKKSKYFYFLPVTSKKVYTFLSAPN